MSVFAKTIIAVEVKDDGPQTRKRLETQLGMDDITFVYSDSDGAVLLKLGMEDDGTVRTAPLGSWVYRDDEYKLRHMTEADLRASYGEAIAGTEDYAVENLRKLFISCPMRGKTEDEIIDERAKLCSVAEAYFEESFEVIDSYVDVEPRDGLKGDALGIWYLGNAIQKLAKADIAIFGDGWFDARGCRIEHDICRQYGIPVFEMEVRKPFNQTETNGEEF